MFLTPLCRFADAILKGYAAIFFGERALAGLLVLLASFWNPKVGLAGLFMGVLAVLLPKWMDLPWPDSPVHVCNAILVGLFLAVLRDPGLSLLPWLLLAGVLVVAVRTILGDLLWRWHHLPLLSLPFVLVTWFLLAAFFPAHPTTSLPFPDAVQAWIPVLAVPFLKALGAVVCTPHPTAGLLVFAALLVSSRVLALLAMGGYVLGALFALFWTRQGLGWLPPDAGFNYPLVAMALGGFFLVPSFRSLLAAAFGVFAASVTAAASAQFLAPNHLPVLALPFCVGTLFILLVLRYRTRHAEPHLVLEHPALPEVYLERIRLAKARGIDALSVPLRAPFFGQWQVYQGFDGPHTHRELWRHALDFFIQDGTRSFSGEGRDLADYHCFGLPVLAPATGLVESCRDDLTDMPPGEVDARQNWGNHVLLRLPSGLFVLLAHLRQGSLLVTPGMAVETGMPLGTCGSSGRSPQPHLHLQVQTGPVLGSPTYPFHLTGVLCRASGQAKEPQRSRFHLHFRPEEGDAIANAPSSPALQRSFQFQSGQRLTYALQRSGKGGFEQRILRVEQDLEGTFRILSDRGATATFLRTDAVFGCFDRNDVWDPFLDVWLLALGFTPMSEAALHWTDGPSARLLPGSRWLHGALTLLTCHVLGLSTRYQRRLRADGCIYQIGLHQHPWGLLPTLKTRAKISPGRGLVRIQGLSRAGRWEATLVSSESPVPGMERAGSHLPRPAEVHP
jgi:urea transporter/murein DD-endopeptidase MepM/ murein hydrolase activator NlpD